MRKLLVVLLVVSTFCTDAIAEKNLRPLSARDRVLIIAPHPDDESLAAGGLIQKAIAAHAKIRIVFATNGEANPWAQRFAEKHFTITESDRRRWGKRRQGEALRALAALGVPASNAVFLNLPDQGLTNLLMSENQNALAKFRQVVADWKPTIIAMPGPFDLHPDHSACFIWARVVLGAQRPLELEYIVHGKHIDTPQRIAIDLTAQETDRKSAAILAHESQTKLSRKSLLRFATRTEFFYSRLLLKVADVRQPLLKTNQRTFVASDSTRLHALTTQGSLKWSEIIHELHPSQRVYLKVDQRGLFLDRAGWEEIPVR